MCKMKYWPRFSFLDTQGNQCMNYFLLCIDTMTRPALIKCATVFSHHSPRLWRRDSWDSLGLERRLSEPLPDTYGNYGRASIIQTLVTRTGTPLACRQGPHHLFMFETCLLIHGGAARMMQQQALRKSPGPHDQGTCLMDRGVGFWSPAGRAEPQNPALRMIHLFQFYICWYHELRKSLTTTLFYKTTDI